LLKGESIDIEGDETETRTRKKPFQRYRRNGLTEPQKKFEEET
jgi:hypothetical protein